MSALFRPQFIVKPISLVRYHMHDDVIKWKHFPRNWPFVRGIHRSPVNSPHKGQWRGALMLSLIRVWINDWVNNGEAGDLRCHRAHYDVIVMVSITCQWSCYKNQCWLMIYKVLRKKSQCNVCRNGLDMSHRKAFGDCIFRMTHIFSRDQWVNGVNHKLLI